MLNNKLLDNKVIENLVNIKLQLLYYPAFLLFLILLFFLKEDAFSVKAYIDLQKDLFYSINGSLSKLPNLQFNLTQLGDVLIFASLLAVFIIYTPKLWGALLPSLIIAGVVSSPLKKLFSVPRPAAILDNESFVIIGRTLRGSTSLPSGHSIGTFVIMTLILYAFMPKGVKEKVIWYVSVFLLGLIFAFSRVGVGAHYPLDVIIGCIIGYMCTIGGIVLNNKLGWKPWFKNKKYYPVLIVLLFIWGALITKKVMENNLMIFYISLISIIITLFLTIKRYVKK